MIFLQEATVMSGAAAGGLLALILGFFMVFFILAIGIYLYSSFAFMSIAKKNNQETPGLAWIPYVGPLIVMYHASKAHWWPFIVFGLAFIPFVNLVAAVMGIIWLWKTFEAIGKPGWWALLMLVPVLNIIILGVAAWSK